MSLVGAGNFARLIMMPILSKLGAVAWRGLCTAKGMNAEHSGRKMGFAFAATDVQELWHDRDTSAVFLATRHDLHAELVIAALRAGKHVFVEKPLCIEPSQLEAIDRCVTELGKDCPILMVGFNRRFAPATDQVRTFFSGVIAPFEDPDDAEHRRWGQLGPDRKGHEQDADGFVVTDSRASGELGARALAAAA